MGSWVILATLVASLISLALLTAPALARYLPAPTTTFGSEGTGAGQFTEPAGVAVNDSSEAPTAGDVYVVDKGNNRVERFTASGGYLSQFNASGTLPGEGPAAPTGRFSGPEEIAVDNSGNALDPSLSDVYVADSGHHVVDRFSAAGEYKSQITGTCAAGPCTGEEAFGELHGVAVDPSGNLWVYQGKSQIDEFTAAGVFIRSFSSETSEAEAIPGLAADSAGDIDLISGGQVLRFDSVSGTLINQFDHGAQALALNPATSQLLVDRGESIDVYAPHHETFPTPTQTFPAEGLAESHGIGVAADSTVYASQRVADSVDIFARVLLPTPVTGAATQTSPTSETVNGTVNPEGLPISDCRFEYAIFGTPAGQYPHSVACAQAPANVGSGAAPVAVSADITGLRPGSTYHYRLASSNAHGVEEGTDETFIATQNLGPPTLSLPDNRAYELVSTIPGAEVDPPPVGQFVSFEEELAETMGNVGGYRAAANGETVAYVGGPPPSGEGGTGVSHNTAGNHYLGMREATGWADANIEPDPENPEMEDLSADLSLQLFRSEDPSFKAAHGGPTGCLGTRTNGSSVLYARSGGIGTARYRPLFTETRGPHECFAQPAGVSADNAHILLDSPFALTPGANAAITAIGGNLYDSTGGRLLQVNILPDGHPQPQANATFGSSMGEVSSSNPGDYKGAISADGSRVFWTDLNTGIVYVRENDAQAEEACTPAPQAAATSCTVQVSAGSAQFLDATPDGRYVYYTEAGELLRFDTLTQTRGAIAGPGSEVQGLVGVNEAGEDGAYVYFVADAVLTGANAEGEQPTAKQPNLYMAHDGSDTFVTTLANSDNELKGTTNGSENAGDWRAQPGRRTAEVAPDGQTVAFMSTLPLTGYDNHGVVGENNSHELLFGEQSEVFVFRLATGRIVCVSCNPTGAPPARTAEEWETQRGGYVSISGANTFMPRWINADGTEVFFNTSQPLVSRDTNHRQDVYEWQAMGSGGCERAEGCLNLLSGGDAPADAYFLDAGTSGKDVFFTSRELLLPTALNETVKVYDARAGGGFPQTSLACTGTGCQGVAPASPIFATPASVTFEGVGNFPPSQPATSVKPKPKKPAKCKRGHAKKKGKKTKKSKCVKTSRRNARKSLAKRGGK